MSDINTSKVDGNTVSASEFNQLAEIDNLIYTSGQTPSISNLEQISIGSARYSSAGEFFTDSGTANAYVLSPVSPFKSPVSATAGESYFNGMVICFRAGNANTGASTVNVNGAGVKNLLKQDGTALSAGDIPSNSDVQFRYNGTSFLKVLGNATSTTEGIVLRKSPTIQKFTSGSGTYTTPSGVLYLKIKMVGGGGGGSGSGSGAGTGGTGGNSTFGTSLLFCGGGVGGIVNVVRGGEGGAASLGTGPIGTTIKGGWGLAPYTSAVAGTYAMGGAGANSPFGGAGAGAGASAATTGFPAEANSGSGGGGAGGSASTTFGGSGGGAGGYIDAIIASPLATYLYAIGSGGSGGSAGASGFVGGAGGSGYIEITEYYN